MTNRDIRQKIIFAENFMKSKLNTCIENTFKIEGKKNKFKFSHKD